VERDLEQSCNMKIPKILRILTAACFIIALICAAWPTTVFGASWFVWTSAGLIAWCVEPLLA
jgi:hypothetical protein